MGDRGELVIRHTDEVTRCGPFRLGRVGLDSEGSPSFEDWAACGQFLQRATGRVQWWIGDWLNYGERRWGERYAEAVEMSGLDYQTLRHTASIAGKFDLCRRRHNLPFTTHAEVAALGPAEADALLDRAERESLSTRQVRLLARQAKATAALAPVGTDLCTAADLGALAARGLTFGTVYADPPWAYSNQATRASTGNHYGTMTVDELAALPVRDLAAPRSHLWLWTTNAFLFDCPRLFAAWGFEFKSSYVWVKPQMGIGNYLRNSHEFLLLAVRGGLTAAARDVTSWGLFDRAGHSAKPERVRSRVVERLSPGPRLELFGRRVAPGWVVWGDQVSRTMFDAEVRELT